MANATRARREKSSIPPSGGTYVEPADLYQATERIRQAACRDNALRFTALWHHVYQVDRLRAAYLGLKRDAAPGIDNQTWQHYGEHLEENLHTLSQRLQRGAYRAQPVRRAYIPKADGNQRPLGVTTLEDKIVQRSTVEVLNAIYETDFLGFSYGFRPERSPHEALDALYVGLMTKKVSWVLDVDIRGYFDTIDRNQLVRMVQHRIADPRVIRQIMKWLYAGVLEEGIQTDRGEGVPQGSSISPLLSNVYLHYVFDLWVQRWRQRQARGDVVVVRFADDIVIGFQHQDEAMQFQEALRHRFAPFNLALHPEKTRLIEFGRYAAENRRQRGEGKPEHFEFLGFTHVCARSRKGNFEVLRQTIRKRMQAKLKEIQGELRHRLHAPIPRVGRWLRSVLQGYFQYYGLPGNTRNLSAFHYYVGRIWHRTLRRRSQRQRLTWKRMDRLIHRWFPSPRVTHPNPDFRLYVITRGKSPVR